MIPVFCLSLLDPTSTALLSRWARRPQLADGTRSFQTENRPSAPVHFRLTSDLFQRDKRRLRLPMTHPKESKPNGLPPRFFPACFFVSLRRMSCIVSLISSATDYRVIQTPGFFSSHICLKQQISNCSNP